MIIPNPSAELTLMIDSLIKSFSMETHHPSLLLSMDSIVSSSPNELNPPKDHFTPPPDINLPLTIDRSPTPPRPWNSILGKKCSKREDTIWGAWFFFNFYFKPVLNANSKAKKKIKLDGNGVSGFNKFDLDLDVFIVQHDMENMYMWVFKEKPENALGKMQLRSYMNGHTRQGYNHPFPFSVEKGFVRSHRMQRKQYRGLSNPQCLHGIEAVLSPDLSGVVSEEDLIRWRELTGRDLHFTIPMLESSGFGSWRNVPNGETGSRLKRRREISPSMNQPPKWVNEFSGVMVNVWGPVMAAKSIYEDEEGYLIVISLPFVDLGRVRVSWRNTPTHGIVKVSCLSTSRRPYIKREERVFRLNDESSEHCPPGEFMREIPLSTRIPKNANIEAYYSGPGTTLEILVPKIRDGVEEHEVRVLPSASNWQ